MFHLCNLFIVSFNYYVFQTTFRIFLLMVLKLLFNFVKYHSFGVGMIFLSVLIMRIIHNNCSVGSGQGGHQYTWSLFDYNSTTNEKNQQNCLLGSNLSSVSARWKTYCPFPHSLIIHMINISNKYQFTFWETNRHCQFNEFELIVYMILNNT